MTLSMRLLPHVSVGLLALVLAGCGGGGDDGTSLLDETRDALEMAEDERDAALAAQATAEAAEMEAETAREAAVAAQATAEAAEMEAETAREAAVAAYAVAESARMMAETARLEAVAAQEAAEDDRATADTAREAAELARVAAEADTGDAQAAQAAAVLAQEAAEFAQAAAVRAQEAAESAQMMAETARLAAEDDQMMAETARLAAVAAKEAAERERDSAVAAQEAAEDDRATADAAREAAELARVAAEADTGDAQAAQAAAVRAQEAAELALIAEETAREAAVAAQTAAEAARDLARSERDAARDDLDQARDDLVQAREDATNDAIDNAVEIARLEDEVEGLEGDVDQLTMDLADANMDLADANMDLADANMKLAELEERQSEGNLRGSEVAALISTMEGEATDDADTPMFGEGFGSDTMMDNMGGGYTKISHNRTDGLVFAVDDNMDDGDTNPFSQGSAPMSLGVSGWNGATFDAEVPGGSDRQVVVYTNIEAPDPETFAEAYGGLKTHNFDYRTNDMDQYLDEDGEVILVNGEAVTTAATPPEGAVLVGSHGGYFTSEDFQDEPAPGDPDLPAENATAAGYTRVAADTPLASKEVFWLRVRFNAAHEADYTGPPDADTDPPAGGFVGSFDNVPGTFTCLTTEGCSVDITGTDGLYSADTWSFVPDDSGATVATTRLDGDYLQIGWWMEEPDLAAGDYKFSRFYGGGDPYTTDQIASIMGTATYEGPAAGIFAERTRELDTANHGTFRADAVLEADFVNSTIDGTISKFVLSDGSYRETLPDWQVVLVERMTTDSRVNNPDNGSIEGKADGRPWGEGMWESEFYGNGGTRGLPSQQPRHVAGQFNAEFGIPDITGMDTQEREMDEGFVGVSGVFGATRQPPPADEM